jgi:Helix-turn-helix domain
MATQRELEPYLTPAEVAARYRTTVANIRYWRHKGTGPRGVVVGRRLLFPRAEVERFDAELLARTRAAS